MAGAGSSKDSISLNITPMMDVFSILITFLLMTYSTDPINIDPKQGLELPKSMTVTPLDAVPTISVTQTAIYINDKPVVEVLPQGDIPESEKDQGAVRKVYDELVKIRKITDRALGRPEDSKKPRSIVFEMDKSLGFKLARRVMLAAQQADFVKVKLLVKRQGN